MFLQAWISQATPHTLLMGTVFTHRLPGFSALSPLRVRLRPGILVVLVAQDSEQDWPRPGSCFWGGGAALLASA